VNPDLEATVAVGWKAMVVGEGVELGEGATAVLAV
jgi:hypothetical protein